MADLKERYAAALFELSVESGEVDAHAQQVEFVLAAMQTHSMQDFLIHPHVPDTEKKQLLHKLFDGKVSNEIIGFLCLTISKSREALIVPALKTYLDLKNAYSGKVVAEIVSAAELSSKQKNALSGLLSKKLDKHVELKLKVDPALIGGFYIQDTLDRLSQGDRIMEILWKSWIPVRP